MKRGLTIFLQVVIVLIGIGAAAFMLWEPTAEGVNAHATLFQIYSDPFVLIAYTVSVAFFTALYQAFKALGLVRNNQTFSPATAKALRIIRYCAFIILAFIVPAVAYLFIARPGDDIAGGVFMGMLITVISIIIAITAAMLEKRIGQKTI